VFNKVSCGASGDRYLQVAQFSLNLHDINIYIKNDDEDDDDTPSDVLAGNCIGCCVSWLS
jgi:hypothetical protein